MYWPTEKIIFSLKPQYVGGWEMENTEKNFWGGGKVNIQNWYYVAFFKYPHRIFLNSISIVLALFYTDAEIWDRDWLWNTI